MLFLFVIYEKLLFEINTKHQIQTIGDNNIKRRHNISFGFYIARKILKFYFYDTFSSFTIVGGKKNTSQINLNWLNKSTKKILPFFNLFHKTVHFSF